jgi:hypothetical protein
VTGGPPLTPTTGGGPSSAPRTDRATSIIAGPVGAHATAASTRSATGGGRFGATSHETTRMRASRNTSETRGANEVPGVEARTMSNMSYMLCIMFLLDQARQFAERVQTA